MTFELEYLERDCEMTVLPQPKAPGMAVVPPCTQLQTLLIVVIENQVNNKLGNAASASVCVCVASYANNKHTGTAHRAHVDQSTVGDHQPTSRPQVAPYAPTKSASFCIASWCLGTPTQKRHPGQCIHSSERASELTKEAFTCKQSLGTITNRVTFNTSIV
jgi:hypothetical protein